MHLTKLIILVTTIKVKRKFSIQPFSWSPKLKPEEKVTQIER